ncbi:MAG: zinc ABC transporter substrate-binding protein [Bacilli bacterium]|nr:zinc ABC transporter substrate-binding protein [Bacilli bacterium]
MKKILTILIMFILLITVSGCNLSEDDNKLTILATNFPCYDFARAITKDVPNTSVEMLLKPGTEAHDYEPSPKDITKISKSDIFIYVGGESDEWVKDLLKSIDTKKVKVVKLMDLADKRFEEDPQTKAKSKDLEYDEHVWTGPRNDIKILNGLNEIISEKDPYNSSLYKINTDNYISELREIDSEMWRIGDNLSRNILVFGDRFPFKYLVNEYNFNYYAAFPGCSSETEASSKTISNLIKIVKENNVPVIIRVDYSNGKIAKTIADETGAKVLTMYSGHNITEEEFNSGKTMIDIMKGNIAVIKEALQ